LRFLADADDLQVPFFYFSPPNVIPKLALGKLSIVQLGPCIGLVDGQGGIRVMPGGSQADYYGAVLTAVASYKSVLLVPSWIAGHIKGGKTKVAVQHHEFLASAATLADYGTPALRNIRRNVRTALKVMQSEWWNGEAPERLLEVNQAWYREASDRFFRTYDKTSLDHLITHWREIEERFPDCCIMVQRHLETGAVLGFNVGCRLTDAVWTSYTQRYLRTDDARGANFVGLQRLSQMLSGMAKGLGNIGTADSSGIRAWKEDMQAATLTAYKVSR
jgi:hypothetical protein